MTAPSSSTKQSIFAHPVVSAWLAKLQAEDRAEVERQYEGWPPDTHRPYFFYALACLDPSPTPLEPTYAAMATGKTWLESVVTLYRGVRSDVLIQLALDCAATAAELEHLTLNPDMTEPWTVLDLSDYRALLETGEDTLLGLASELCHLQTERLRQLAPDHKALEQALATKRLELNRIYN